VAGSVHGRVPGQAWPDEDPHSPWTDSQGPRQVHPGKTLWIIHHTIALQELKSIESGQKQMIFSIQNNLFGPLRKAWPTLQLQSIRKGSVLELVSTGAGNPERPTLRAVPKTTFNCAISYDKTKAAGVGWLYRK